MRSIAPPISSVGNILVSLAGNIENRDLAARLLAAQPHIVQLEQEYMRRASNNSLHTFPAEAETNGISQGEMSWLYSRSFARKGIPTRPLYEALKMSAPGEICPLCNQRVVRTLDHHLSKQDYPAFSVTPVNLVPACRDCNSDTLARPMRAPEDQTFHPYFDNVDDDIWLHGHVEESRPPVVRFEARPPAHWVQDKRTKVVRHFRIFKLGTLYTTHAGSELQNIYGDVDVIAQRGDALVIKDELAQRALARRRVVRNNWQAAMYAALSDSDWFCQGGFREIVA